MKNIKLTLSYDGTNYLGWQKTKMGPSIEEELEKALTKILQHPVSLQAASRTDAGVHASAQVVNFFTPKKPLNLQKIQYSLNCLLPKTIRTLEIKAEKDDFHPTLGALKKEYHYFVNNDPIGLPFKRLTHWHFPYGLDMEDMEQAAACFVGKHDFSCFCNTHEENPENKIRKIYRISIFREEDDTIRFEVVGDRFLYKMVRNIVGTLIYVGCGRLTLKDIETLIDSKDRTKAGITAPAHGLMLRKIFYEESQ